MNELWSVLEGVGWQWGVITDTEAAAGLVGAGVHRDKNVYTKVYPCRETMGWTPNFVENERNEEVRREQVRKCKPRRNESGGLVQLEPPAAQRTAPRRKGRHRSPLLATEEGARLLKQRGRRLVQKPAGEEDNLLRHGAKSPSAETSQNTHNTFLLETLCLTCFKAGQWVGLPCEAAGAQFPSP